MAMDVALKKLELMQRLMLIWDEASLQRVAKAIETEVPDVNGELPDEDIPELERRRARYLSGESVPLSVEESMRLARKAAGR
jgi:hypothetical protein